MKNSIRKNLHLHLDREMVRALSSYDLGKIAGGKWTEADTCDICDPSVGICTK